MTIGRPVRRALAAVIFVAASTSLTGVASAESVTVPDPADVSSASLSDIREVKARHGERRVFVRVSFTELEPESEAGGSSLSLFVDTDPDRRGPEFRLASGLQWGTDYQLVRMRDWRPVGEPLSCRHSLTLGFKANVLKARMGRACLDGPVAVRVGAKMVDMYDASHPVVDWLKKPRGFTRWLAVG